jgi:hypothetical protein
VIWASAQPSPAALSGSTLAAATARSLLTCDASARQFVQLRRWRTAGTDQHRRLRVLALLQCTAPSVPVPQAVKITPQTDFSRLKVGQLKELLRDRGISCRDCFEKADFIAKLRDLAAAQT